MYGKIFRQMFTGSLYGKFEAMVTLQAAVVLSDREGYLHYTEAALIGTTGYPAEVIRKGLVELMEPDPRSRSKEHEGRRIIPLDDTGNGFLVVNKPKYAGIREQDEIRDQARERQRRHRLKAAGDDVTPSHAPSRDVTPSHAPSRHIDIDKDVEKKRSAMRAFPADADEKGWKALGEHLGIEPKTGEEMNAFKARIRRQAHGIGRAT
jgi:hypothetical protein